MHFSLFTSVEKYSKMVQEHIRRLRKPKAAIHSTLLFLYALKFSENVQFYFAVFPKKSNSNSIFYSSMEYLTTKTLYPHPNQKHVALLHSKRQLVVLALDFIEQWKIELELELEYFLKTSKQNMKLLSRIRYPPSASIGNNVIIIISINNVYDNYKRKIGLVLIFWYMITGPILNCECNQQVFS